jgi:ATP:corrinoid adenosyltransferase
MPRKNYMTINAHETVQQMFDEFVSRKEIQKTVALNDMLEMYMLAKDEDLYMELKRKYLNVEGVKQMLADRDNDSSLVSDELFLFMKLGFSYDNQGN